MDKVSRAKPNRRQFLTTTAGIAAGSLLSPALVSAARNSAAANERVNVAFIGIAQRGAINLKSMLATGICNPVAMCDVDPTALQGALDKLKEGELSKYIEPVRQKPFYSDFRKMLDKHADEIDAVLIATPDHSHFAAAMLAMSLGKHVYVEKPLAHTFGQCERLIDLAKRSGVVTQMGNQGHSAANRTQFEAWTTAGVIKDVTRITAFMNKPRRWHGWGTSVSEYPQDPLPTNFNWESWAGPAKMNPFSKKLHPGNWRSWFDYGCGALGDWAPHLLDTSHRYLKLGLPEKVTAVKLEGQNQWVYPQATTLRFDFPEREGPERQRMPACQVDWFDGLQNVPDLGADFSEFQNVEPGKIASPGKAIYSATRSFHGTSHAATLNVVSGDQQNLPEYETELPDHWENFLLACRGEAEANSPFSVGGPLTQVLNLGMIAQQLGGELAFDRDSKRFVNNDAANAMLDPEPRTGWQEFYQL